jgi:hypothetical protein
MAIEAVIACAVVAVPVSGGFRFTCLMTSNESFAAYNKIWVSNLSEASLFSHHSESLLELIMNDITSPPDCLCRRATHEHHAARRTSYPKMIVATSLTSCPTPRRLRFLWPVSRAPRSQGIARGYLNSEPPQVAEEAERSRFACSI